MKQSMQELAETETPDVRGPSLSTYGLTPVEFLRDIVSAAEKQMYFANFAKVMYLPKGIKTVSIPKKTVRAGYSGMTWDTAGVQTGAGSGAGQGPYANTIADISWTSMTNNTSVTATPLPVMAGYAIRRFDMDTNALNLLEEAKTELSYAIGDRIDVLIAQQMGTADGLTFAQSGTRGAIQLYGGTATADSGLVTGNTLNASLIATAARYLKGKENWYRDGGSGLSGTLTLDTTVEKNPWMNTADEPFVLFIGVAQEEALRKDSQFVNAAEYGSNRVVVNGEIGELGYLGIKVVVTVNTESFAASATGPDNSTVSSGLAGGMTRCLLIKARKAYALVYGQEPEIKVFPYESRDEIRIALYTAYAITILYSDAVVALDVANA